MKTVRVVAFHRGPRWLVWIKRHLRPYERVTRIEAIFRAPMDTRGYTIFRAPMESRGYVSGIVLKWGDDKIQYDPEKEVGK